MNFFWWGLADYQRIEGVQHNVCTQIQAGDDELILAGEHPTVITLGRRATAVQILTAKLPVVKSSRGGLATLHSPGQLVIYPILNLRKRAWGVRDYVCALLQSTQLTLKKIGIVSSIDTNSNPGIFTDHGKIAFCGLQIKQGISQYGIAVNISNDLELFKNLVPCGHHSQELDRVQNYQGLQDSKITTTELFFEQWLVNFNSLIK